jgi:hypothetical protein
MTEEPNYNLTRSINLYQMPDGDLVYIPFMGTDILKVEQHHQCTRLYTRKGRMWTILRTKGKHKLSKKVKQITT